jgi:hypothetical protein
MTRDYTLNDTYRTGKSWNNYELILFRIAFFFFIFLSVPNNPEWYRHTFNIDWTNLHYRDLYDICRFGSGINFFGNKIFGSTLYGYANWIITLIVSAVTGLLWTIWDNRKSTRTEEYDNLYYWLRVIVRYRAALGIIGFGFTKLLPVQMPYPSLGLLNTDFGDFTAQKIYWMSIGIVPWYQIFAGVVEVLAGAFLFFRGTTLIGSVLLFGALGDIVYVNFAYDGGVHGYSSYFVLLSGFLILQYIPALYKLVILEQPVKFSPYYPVFSKGWQVYSRIGLKAGIIYVFLILFFYLQVINFQFDPYKQPSTPGVKQLRGNYAVTEFRINNKVIPFNPLDTVRWQEATFEKWTSLTFRVNKPHPLDLGNGGGDPQRDINRTFELTGTAGGQRVYHYFADTINKVLYLQDKYKAVADRRNRAAGAGEGGAITSGHVEPEIKTASSDPNWISKEAWANIGEEVSKIDEKAASTRRNREFAEYKGKFDKRNRMTLKYSVADDNKIVLTGMNESNDSIYVVLQKIERDYLLSESSLSAGKYD